MDKVAIPGYEGFYEVDINGNVFSMRTDKFLKPYEKSNIFTFIDLLHERLFQIVKVKGK